MMMTIMTKTVILITVTTTPWFSYFTLMILITKMKMTCIPCGMMLSSHTLMKIDSSWGNDLYPGRIQPSGFGMVGRSSSVVRIIGRSGSRCGDYSNYSIGVGRNYN